jgi:hypothetical protein
VCIFTLATCLSNLITPWLDDNVPAPLATYILTQAVDLPPTPQLDDSGEGPSKKTHSTTPAGTSPSGKPAGVMVPKWLKSNHSVSY